MPEPASSDVPHAPSRQEYLEAFLLVLGVVVVAGSLIGGLVGLGLTAVSQQASGPATYLLIGGVMLAGMALGGILAGLAILLTQQRTTVRSTSAPAGSRTDSSESSADAMAGRSKEWSHEWSSTSATWGREIPELLREIRDTVLLDDQQRRARWQRLQSRRRQELMSAIRRALKDEGSLVEAERLLNQLAEKFPAGEGLDQLRQEYEWARVQLQSRDLEQTQRRVLELEAVNSYQRAEEVAQALMNRHPELMAAKELLVQVRQDRQNHHERERLRQFDELDQLTLAKQWSRALQLAESFLAGFPKGPEAELVRQRLGLLRANTEIAKRQHLEEQFKDLLKAHRYGQALELAQFIVAAYPQSPQAEALRDQLPRLRHLAGEGKVAPPPSTRS